MSGLPYGLKGKQLQEFLNAALQEVAPSASPGAPVVNTWVGEDGLTAFCELRSVDETDSLVALSGLELKDKPLKIGRPKSYGPAASQPAAPTVGTFSHSVGLNPLMMSSNVLMATNFPRHLGDRDIKRVVTPFGALETLNVLKDFDGVSKGAVVFRYADDKATSNAISGLNGLQIGELKLVVQRVPPNMIPTLI